MGEGHRREQQPSLLQILEDQGIRILDEGAGPGRPLDEFPLGVHQVDKGQPVFPADPVVVLAEGRRDMDDAGAVLHGNIVVADDEPGLLVRLDEAIQRLVGHPPQAFPVKLLQDLGFPFPKDLFHQGPGQDVDLPVVRLHPAIGVPGVDAKPQVAG